MEGKGVARAGLSLVRREGRDRVFRQEHINATKAINIFLNFTNFVELIREKSKVV